MAFVLLARTILLPVDAFATNPSQANKLSDLSRSIAAEHCLLPYTKTSANAIERIQQSRLVAEDFAPSDPSSLARRLERRKIVEVR